MIVWSNGERYYFSRKQKLVVRRLWEAWESGRPEVDQSALLRAADSDSLRLVDLFRSHPAWNTLIVKAGPTLYRLAVPDEELARHSLNGHSERRRSHDATSLDKLLALVALAAAASPLQLHLVAGGLRIRRDVTADDAEGDQPPS